MGIDNEEVWFGNCRSAALGGSAYAADMKMPVKAVAPPVIVSPWDFAFGASITNDYRFRGIAQSNRQPSVAAYFEPRYNVSDTLQLYAGVGGASISFPNRAAAEIDVYGGIRPTFGAFAFDFGVFGYLYPGGPLLHSGGVPRHPQAFRLDLECVINVFAAERQRHQEGPAASSRSTARCSTPSTTMGARRQLLLHPVVPELGRDGHWVSGTVEVDGAFDAAADGSRHVHLG